MVKGKTKPGRGLRSACVAGASRTEIADELPLVGRDARWRLFDDALGRRSAGNGAVVEIVGEPGIGKSRLLGGAAPSAAGDPRA